MLSSSLPSFGSTSSHLITRLQGREAEAWERMADLYAPLVFYWCRRSNLQQADAADVLQNVFVSVASAIEGFDRREGSTFRGWLWTITRNKIHDYHRDCQRDGRPRGGSSARDGWAC